MEERRYHAATVELAGMDLAYGKLQWKHLLFDDDNLGHFMHPRRPVCVYTRDADMWKVVSIKH